MFNPFSFILRHGALHYPVLDCVSLLQVPRTVATTLGSFVLTGRADAINTDTPLTTITSLGGNDGCTRSYRFPNLGATCPSLVRLHTTLNTPARRASSTVVPSS